MDQQLIYICLILLVVSGLHLFLRIVRGIFSVIFKLIIRFALILLVIFIAFQFIDRENGIIFEIKENLNIPKNLPISKSP